MSAATPEVTRVGSAWYSAWARSGGLPALSAVSSLVTSVSPCDWVLSATWISGCCLFQIATTLSMFGAQAQKLSVTGPVSGVAFGGAESLGDELQAATRAAPR